MDKFNLAVHLVGGQTALARALGVKQGHVHYWLNSGKVPGHQCPEISRATEWKITPHELRPDAYPNPWDGLPIWMARSMLCDCLKVTPPESDFTRPTVTPVSGPGAFYKE